MIIIYLSDEEREAMLSLLRREVDLLEDDGIYKQLAELFEKAPEAHTVYLDR